MTECHALLIILQLPISHPSPGECLITKDYAHLHQKTHMDFNVTKTVFAIADFDWY